MRKYIFLIIVLHFFTLNSLTAQNYSTQNCHSHNDYLQKMPFFDAYNLGFGSIEIDVFGVENELYVAHSKNEIDSSKTFKTMYLTPILNEIEKNNNKLQQPLQLLIDLKTGGETLKWLESQLISYKDQFKKAKISIVISGEMPKPDEFLNYTEMFNFDGRAKQLYTKKQLSRVALYSQNFQEIVVWNGKKQLDDDQTEQVENFIKTIHKKGKKLRFWATPDTPISWHTLMILGVDFVGTDNLQGLGKYLK